MDLRDEACGIGQGPAKAKVDLINKLTGVNKVKKMTMIEGWGYKFANIKMSQPINERYKNTPSSCCSSLPVSNFTHHKNPLYPFVFPLEYKNTIKYLIKLES